MDGSALLRLLMSVKDKSLDELEAVHAIDFARAMGAAPLSEARATELIGHVKKLNSQNSDDVAGSVFALGGLKLPESVGRPKQLDVLICPHCNNIVVS